MTSANRRKEILRILQNNITVETAQLSEQFGVTPMTIRRDFEYFEQQGLITTIYGGAMINTVPFGGTTTIDMDSPDASRAAEKREIARAAAAMIEDGQTILLDAGSTVKELAVELIGRKHLTVLTNSILVVNTLAQIDNDIRLHVLPGKFHRSSMAFFGASTNAYLESIHVDISFLGVMGISAAMGGTVLDMEEGRTKEKIGKVATKSVILADHTKLGKDTLFSVVSPGDLSMLITGRGGAREELDALVQQGVQIVEA